MRKYIVIVIIITVVFIGLGGILVWYMKSISNADNNSEINQIDGTTNNSAVTKFVDVPSTNVADVTTSGSDAEDTNGGVDERTIDDSGSVGTGIKFVFVDAVTGERVRNGKVTLDSDNGIRCDMVGCDSSDTLFETQSDHNGVAFIDFNQWPKFFFGHVILENWDCNGSIITYPSDNHLYFTEDTKQLLVECVSKTYSIEENHTKFFKLLEAGSEEELRNVSVTIDIENCGSDSCSDLNDVVLTSNQLGNLFFDGDYLRADTYFIIDGYKPLSIMYEYEDRYADFIKIVNGSETIVAIDDQVKAMHQLQNVAELYYSEHAAYPHPKTWDELVEALQDYIEPFPITADSAVSYTYGYSIEDERYCLITALTGDDEILLRDDDQDRCKIRPGAWQSISTGVPETDCDDDQLLLCLGT